MGESPNDTVLFDVLGNGVARLQLNRPKTLNAFNADVHAALKGCFDQLENLGEDLKCVLIGGVGRAFCAGQDLAERAEMLQRGDVDLGASLEQNYNPLILRMRKLPAPIIAVVNGIAAGAGAAFAVNADIVLASRSAGFQFSFVKAGLGPDSGASWILPRLTGRAVALGALLTGEKIDAERAERLGLIWKCVDDADLETEAEAIAFNLAAAPSNAIRAIKRRVHDANDLSFVAALDAECKSQQMLGRHSNYREAVMSFIEKRPPEYT